MKSDKAGAQQSSTDKDQSSDKPSGDDVTQSNAVKT